MLASVLALLLGATLANAGLSEGIAARERGDLVAARFAFERALREKPGNPETLLDLAEVHLRDGDLPRVGATLREAARAGATGRLHRLEGNYHEELGLRAAAALAYRRALEGGEDLAARHRLARLLAADGQSEEAVMHWTRISAAAPDDLAAHQALVDLFAASRRAADEERELAEVARLRPKDPRPLRRLAALARARGDRQTASLYEGLADALIPPKRPMRPLLPSKR